MAESFQLSGDALAPFLLERLSVFLPLILLTAAVVVIVAITLDVAYQEEATAPPAGCRRLGLQPGRSNLQDQHDQKYATGSNEHRSSWKVKALCIYPVKSCSPVELDVGDVIASGMRYDRQFTFTQLISSVAKDGSRQIDHQWSFITQRQSPHLTKVTTELWVPDPSSPTYSPDAEFVRSEGCIEISFPYTDDKMWIQDRLEKLGAFIRKSLPMQPTGGHSGPRVRFRVPFNPPPERIADMAYPRELMRIWNECPRALNMGAEIPATALAKLKYALGISNQLTLFRIDPQSPREVYRCAPRKGQQVDYQPAIGMADAYPLHILNLASVHDVASRLPRLNRLDAIRFRANIYITGPPAYAEDDWRIVRIGRSRRYHVSCRTARCTLPNVDPATGELDGHNEPYKTMSSFRKIDAGAAKWPCLGMQLVPLSADPGELRVGDEVVVEAVGEHHYIPQRPPEVRPHDD